MRPMRVKDIVRIVDGKLISGDGEGEVSSVQIDSRKIKPGALYVPIIGERVNGHTFISQVFEQGAVCSFTSDKTYAVKGKNCIYVKDTLYAMQTLATYYRSLFTMPVIGVTGSVGKTTTKEMISCVLEKKYRVLKTEGNLNSQIGVSLMMFKITEDTEVCVFEMGISEKHEMNVLARICDPDYGVMTNIGVSHIGQLGSRQNICQEKSDIVNYFQNESKLYLCSDKDYEQLFMCTDHVGEVKMVTYATDKKADFYAEDVKMESETTSFTVKTKGAPDDHVTLSVLGMHNVSNALVALALGDELGVEREKAKEALLAYRPIKMRGEVKKNDKFTVIDDTYNASPDSIKSGLDMMFAMPGNQKIAVLADVLELGEWSKECHQDVGKYIVEKVEQGCALSLLITLGIEMVEASKIVADKTDVAVKRFGSNQEAIDYIKDFVQQDDIVFVKGSRGMHTDEIVNALQ